MCRKIEQKSWRGVDSIFYVEILQQYFPEIDQMLGVSKWRWTSNNKQLDEFIKKSQLQTNSPNHAYLEWIPFDCIRDGVYDMYLYGLPIYVYVKLTPLEITDETHDLYYAEVN